MSTTATAPVKRRRTNHPLRTIFAEVASASTLNPGVRRVVITSPEFDGFITDFPDQFITLIFPLPHQERPQIERGFTWEEFVAMPDEIRPIARNYTVRRYDPARREVTVDFVQHHPPGFGAQWAVTAKPGDQIAVWGPRVGYNPFPNTDWQLLIADETGLPAMGAILEALPLGARAHAIVEVANPSLHQELTSPAEITIDWRYRGDAPVGAQLLAAVEALTFPEDGLLYAWGGAEMGVMTAYGRHLRRQRGLKTAAISSIGYWRAEGE